MAQKLSNLIKRIKRKSHMNRSTLARVSTTQSYDFKGANTLARVSTKISFYDVATVFVISFENFNG